jgi:hypothetical protein
MPDIPDVSDDTAPTTPEPTRLPPPEPLPSQEPAPTIDIHPPHHAATTWRDFLIHIATIVLGLLIAIALEQTVELVHRRHEARDARESIKQEIADNIDISQKDLQEFDLLYRELGHDLDLLNSGVADAQTLDGLNYHSAYTRRHDAAWAAAKINGSLALIPSGDLTQASYFYGPLPMPPSRPSPPCSATWTLLRRCSIMPGARAS